MKTPRLLFIEDTPLLVKCWAAYLKMFAIEAIFAGTLAEAVAGLDETIDCVVLDLMLPDGASVDIIQAAHEMEPPVPVVVLTAATEGSEIVKAARSLEPEAFLFKPQLWPDLLGAITEAVQKAERKQRGTD